MATTVSHAMRRYPATPPDNKYSNFSPIRTDSSPSHQDHQPGSSGSALSRSMRYAEPWLYGSVRGAPVLVTAAYPTPSGLMHASTPLLQLCNCPDYLNGTLSGKSKGKGVCKKCKGTRLAVATGNSKQKYGTVRGYSSSPLTPALTSVRAGTVRVTNSSSRASILPPSPTIDPYDLMRRSRLSCSDVGSQFRARSSSPNKSRNNTLDLRNFTTSRPKNRSKSDRSPSPVKSIGNGRKSILECDVNPYELMSLENQVKNGSDGRNKRKGYLDNSDYEDVEISTGVTIIAKNTANNNRLISQIPKLQNKSKKHPSVSIKKPIERETISIRNEAKFKSILKKPSATFNDTDLPNATVTESPSNSSNSKSGSHFYLPLPTLTPPRKKVQFLVENEADDEFAGNNDGKLNGEVEEKVLATAPDETTLDDGSRNLTNGDSNLMQDNETQLQNDELDYEPCRLKRSLSERLGHELPNVSFNDTMALRAPKNRSSITDHGGSTLFDAVTDLQRLDGIGPARPRPREPPPPPPPPSPPNQEIIAVQKQYEIKDRPATPPPRSETELGGGYEVTTVKNNTEHKKILKENSMNNDSKQPKEEIIKIKELQNEIKEETPPSVPPRKRSNSKLPATGQIITKEVDISSKKSIPIEDKIDKSLPKQIKDEPLLKSTTNKTPKIDIDTPKITIKSTPKIEENNSPSEINYSYQKVKIEPSKTIVQINSPTIQVIPSTVHRLQIKNEFQDQGNYNKVLITESPQRKTSIMINGDDCYSTVNVNDDVPIYQSSVVVNDYESSNYDSSKIEISSGNKSSSVYITGDFQSNSTPLSSRTSKSEERPKKTLVILEGNSSAPSTPSPTIINGHTNGQSTPDSVGKTFVILQEENKKSTPKENEVEKKNKVNNKLTDNIYEKPSSEELQRLLKDPVEAVKRNLVPHVCGKADVERRTRNKKSITSNSLVARLLEDPFLGSLAEGLETNTVAKLIEDSLIKLRNQDFQEDDKDACSENDYPPYELIEAGSDCYSNHSNRSSVTEDELGTRSKFYQLLADSALSEIEDHHYEIIKANVDPIYEEIEIPPPLPSVPPPRDIIDDLQIDKQFTTRSIFEGASKYDILSYLVDAKERGIVPEEGYTYNFNNSGEVIVEEEEENKERSVFSSRVSHMSTVSDSSEDSSLVITAEKNGPQKSAEVERNDSGVGSETSKCSRSRYLSQPEASTGCEDCDLPVDPQPEDGPLICKKCSKKRSERKEIITEIVETEEKYSRDLQIILEEFYQPMLVAGLLTPEQLAAIFLNVEELLENSQALAERLRDTLEIALEQGDEDLLTVNIGKIFLEAAPMLHAFESYCVRQGPASLLLAGLEKEKELLRIFLRVSQMENTVLRRMNLNSFLMVPVQRVTKYPLLLARLHKVTPLHQESRDLLREAQHKIELHLNHMNSETKDVPSKLWRRISNNNGRRSSSEMDLVNIKLRKIAVDVLEWNHDEARFALEGRLLFTQPTDNNWRKGRTIKLTPINALLVTNGKPNASPKSDRNGSTTNGVLTQNGALTNEDEAALTFPRHTGVREAALLLVRDKGGRYSLLREPLYLDRCVIATDPAWQSYFEVQELLGKDTFIFKAEDAQMTRTWYRQLQYHAQGMGAWRKRRNALANIMINGMGSRS